MAFESSSAKREGQTPDDGIRHRFRSSLEIISAGTPSTPTCFVRNPGTGTLFEVGERGAFVCRRLDGETTGPEIRRLYLERFKQALSAEDLDLFIRQLAQGGLLETLTPVTRKRNFAEILDPEVFLPLGQFRIMRGDRFVRMLARAFAWCYTLPFHTLAIAAMLWGAGIMMVRFPQLCSAIYRNWDTECLLWTLAASSLLIQTPRALVHAITCKRYGRQISGVGIALLYYVLPTLFVGWGDIVWVRERSKRFWAVFSGIYYQGLVWALATIGWHLTRPGSDANYVFIVLWLSAGVGLILMNGNPLVAMDGYLLLSAYYEQKDLRPRSLAAFGAWVLRQPQTEPVSRRVYRWMILYGGLKFVYGVLHLAILLAALWYQLTPTFEGAGALVVLLALLYLAHRPIAIYLGRLRWIRWLFARNASYACWCVRALGASAVVFIAFMPIRYHVGGPFQLLPMERIVVHTEVEGIVERVLVHEGQFVDAGQPIARIAKGRLMSDLHRAELSADQARAKFLLAKSGARPELIERAYVDVVTAKTRVAYGETLYRRSQDLDRERLISKDQFDMIQSDHDHNRGLLEEATAQLASVRASMRDEVFAAKRAEVDSLEAVVKGCREKVERTTIVAPISGRIVTPRIEELTGVYLEPGERDEVAEVANTAELRAEVQVPEEDAARVQNGETVTLAMWAFHDRSIFGRVVGTAPTAAPSISSPVVDPGPNAVELVRSDSGTRAVRVVVSVPSGENRLKAGMTGYAKLDLGSRPLWRVLVHPLIRWFRVEGWSWLP